MAHRFPRASPPIPVRASHVLMFLWALAFLGAPVVEQWAGERWMPILVHIGVGLLLAAVYAHAERTWGRRRTLLTMGSVLGLTWFFEWCGLATGFPFGSYAYSDKLGFQIGGVPLPIPFAWCAMLLPAWGIAALICPRHGNSRRRRFEFASVSGLIMMSWDLYVDPKMVSMGYWEWEGATQYFGVPLLNFCGWWLTVFTVTWIVRPRAFPALPALLVFSLVWVWEAITLAWLQGLGGPAVSGALGMGVLLVWGWAKWAIDSRAGAGSQASEEGEEVTAVS